MFFLSYRLLDEWNESVAFGFERLGVSHHTAVSAFPFEKNKIKQKDIELINDWLNQRHFFSTQSQNKNTIYIVFSIVCRRGRPAVATAASDTPLWKKIPKENVLGMASPIYLLIRPVAVLRDRRNHLKFPTKKKEKALSVIHPGHQVNSLSSAPGIKKIKREKKIDTS
jgi:hypothetical protein